jgi:hypothetical protein
MSAVHVEIQQTRIGTQVQPTTHSQRVVKAPFDKLNVRLGLEESTGKVIHRANNIQIILGAKRGLGWWGLQGLNL